MDQNATRGGLHYTCIFTTWIFFQGQVFCPHVVSAVSRPFPTARSFRVCLSCRKLPCLGWSHIQWLREVGIYRLSHFSLLQDTDRQYSTQSTPSNVMTLWQSCIAIKHFPPTSLVLPIFPSQVLTPNKHFVPQAASHCVHLENLIYNAWLIIFLSFHQVLLTEIPRGVKVAEKTTKTNLGRIVLSLFSTHTPHIIFCVLLSKITRI